MKFERKHGLKIICDVDIQKFNIEGVICPRNRMITNTCLSSLPEYVQEFSRV